MVDFFLILTVLLLATLYLRKRYMINFVSKCIDRKLPSFETRIIELPEKQDKDTVAEHLNVSVGKVLAEKVPDARLIDFKEMEDSICMKYYSADFFSLFRMTIVRKGKDSVSVEISGEKFINTVALTEEMSKTSDHVIPYKIIRNEMKFYESQYEVKFFDMSVFKRFFKRSEKKNS